MAPGRKLLIDRWDPAIVPGIVPGRHDAAFRPVDDPAKGSI